jgi:mRNA interferase RelE/StbE
MRALGNDALPRGAVKLKGSAGSFRIRIGDYRVLYRITATTVEILSVGHRRDVYR